MTSRFEAAGSNDTQRRAERLLRWYPAAWRDRYGEEFSELLISEVQERPRSWRRAVDVARSATSVRMADIGLSGEGPETDEQARASLATFALAVCVFAVLGVSIWAQLTVDWEWSAPATSSTDLGMISMSFAALFVAILAGFAIAPVLGSVLWQLVGGRGKKLVAPAALVALGTTLLVVGGRHFANGWPGTGGHHWQFQGIVPGGVAAFAWSSTLFVSSYWAHPSALGAFPLLELLWMFVSPVAVVCTIVGGVKLMRRAVLPHFVLQFERGLCYFTAFAMTVFLFGAATWIFYGRDAQGQFHAGMIDASSLVLMTLALVIGMRIVRRSRGRFTSLTA